jgi:hypothetical protein
LGVILSLEAGLADALECVAWVVYQRHVDSSDSGDGGRQ